MWVKICGNTRLEDAALAAELGADAVGFVFAERSSRRVSVAQVRAITDGLRAAGKMIETVGVVETGDAEELARTVESAGLSGVQLHGGFDLALAEALRQRLGDQATITQVLHWRVGEDAASAEEVAGQLRVIAESGVVERVLLDAQVGQALGGTGRSFDWRAARAVLDEGAAAGLKMVLAGGLRPDNLAKAIEVAAPRGVDVASGVEASPGVKDAGRLRRFMSIAGG